MPRAVLVAAVATILLPSAARGHGVAHEVDLADGTVSVRIRYHGGKALAGARYEVFAPGAPDRARESGRTDRHGWLVFVPDAPGTWRVRVADASGHGKVVDVEVPQPAVAAVPSGSAEPAEARPPSPPARGLGSAIQEPVAGRDREGDPGLLRVLGGAAALALAFAAIIAIQRRRRAAGR